MKKKIEISQVKDMALQQAISAISGLVKTVCGVANNAAWMACLEAMDKAKEHPRYRKRTMDGRSIKWLFKRVVEEHRKYELNLLYGGPPYFFRLDDLLPATRKQFGDISDSDYYDLWTAVGAKAYEKTRPFTTCLVNKFKVSMERQGIENAEICAWVITGTTCLKIAARVYDSAMRSICQLLSDTVCKTIRPSEADLSRVFNPFSLETVRKLWMEAEYGLDPKAGVEIEDPVEVKNLKTGILQLEEQWMNYGTLYGSAADVFEQYDDVWRTPGEQKKAIKGVLANMRECQEEDDRKHE